MHVSKLREVIESIAGICRSMDAPQKTQESLRSLAQLLAPFDEMSLEQLEEFLGYSKTYKETGVLPIPASTKKSKAAPAKAAPEEIVTKIREIYERALELDYGQIQSQIELLLKRESKPSLLEISKELDISLSVAPSKAKKTDIMDAIVQRAREQKATYDRTRF